MTEATYLREHNCFSLTCKGHAGYAEPGKDIVCAGISALCSALEVALDNLQDAGCIKSHFCSWSNGFFRADAVGADGNCALETAFDLVFNGLCRIEEEYGKNLKCRRNTCAKEMNA